MSPAEVKAMEATEYIAFIQHMNEDIRAQERAQRKSSRRRR